MGITIQTVHKPDLLSLRKARQRADAKLATALHDWRTELCVGQTSLDGCNVELRGLPKLSLQEAYAAGAKTLVLGTAGPGGHMGEAFRPTIKEALNIGFNVASGMHDFLSDDPEISAMAQTNGLDLYDLRKPPEDLSIATGKARTGRRLLTIGTDCSVGKMYTTLALEDEMLKRGMDASFAATGQTGILVAGGKGIPLDAIVSDFTAGEVEKLTPDADPEHWDVIEGQATVIHPSYSGVTTALLHASQPDALVVCHDPTRQTVLRKDWLAVPSIQDTIDAHMASVTPMNARIGKAAPMIAGIALNAFGMDDRDAADLVRRTADEHGLPCVDPIRHGTAPIIDNLQRRFEL